MKIIACDSFARESVADRLVADSIKSEEEAEIILKALTNTCTKEGSTWYKLVDNDYKLWRGMEELI